MADPKYREVLNFDLNEGVGREFTTRLFNIDSNIGIIADRINLDNVSAEKYGMVKSLYMFMEAIK